MFLHTLYHLVFHLLKRLVDDVGVLEQRVCVIDFLGVGGEHFGGAGRVYLLLLLGLAVLVLLVSGCVAAADDLDREDVILIIFH